MLNINKKEIILHSGQGFFINSNALHMIKPYETSDSTYVCINVHPSLLYGSPGNVIEQKYIRPYVQNSIFSHCVFSPEIADDKQILLQLSKIYSLYAKGEYCYEFDILISLLTAWKQLIILQNKKLPTTGKASELMISA